MVATANGFASWAELLRSSLPLVHCVTMYTDSMSAWLNDWHVAHFYNPPDVNPESVMPSYPWFYEADGLTPNRTGLSVIAYVQWLGSWVPTVGETVYDVPFIEETYAPAVLDRPAKPAEAGTMDEGESSTEEGGGDFWE